MGQLICIEIRTYPVEGWTHTPLISLPHLTYYPFTFLSPVLLIIPVVTICQIFFVGLFYILQTLEKRCLLTDCDLNPALCSYVDFVLASMLTHPGQRVKHQV